VEAVKRLNEAGVPCGVLVAPILPGISDGREQIRTVVEACVEAGATFVSPILLHLRPVVRDVYMEWLQVEYPELVGRYEEMYPKAYAARSLQTELREEVSAAITDAGGLRKAKTPKRRNERWQRRPQPEPQSQQMSLL
jgi:DNA repair photolyase